MKNFSTSIQRRKRGKRTEYLARLTYYDKTGKRKGVSKSAPTHWDAKRELQDLIDQHVAGGAEVWKRDTSSPLYCGYATI